MAEVPLNIFRTLNPSGRKTQPELHSIVKLNWRFILDQFSSHSSNTSRSQAHTHWGSKKKERKEGRKKERKQDIRSENNNNTASTTKRAKRKGKKMPQPPSPPPPPLPTTAILPSSPSYEPLRTRFFNARLPAHRPRAILRPTTTAAVAAAVRHAAALGLPVGVRSGGHNFAAPSLVPDGLLLDVRDLNPAFSYDARTQTASFGPGATGEALSAQLANVGRFWPFGHSPMVGVGGFVTNGGQGWFMRGWGAASEWVAALEVVTARGDVVVAAREGEHADLFWAARGGGRAFFGVVTRVWGRTVPMRRVWDATLVFGIGGGDGFEEVMEWVLETDEGPSPRYGVETAVVTCWPDRGEEGARDEVVSRELMLVVNCVAWADSLAEAATLLRPWAEVPPDLENRLVARVPVKETSWEELFKAQDQLNPTGNGERWQCDSIFNDPKVPKKQVSLDDGQLGVGPELTDLHLSLSRL